MYFFFLLLLVPIVFEKNILLNIQRMIVINFLRKTVLLSFVGLSIARFYCLFHEILINQ